MSISGLSRQSAFILLALAFAAAARAPAPPAAKAEPATAAEASFDALNGRWVRPDGGYTIAIKSIGGSGELEAMYFNPNPLPFAKAQASREGATLRASFESRSGGYDGSTYELAYDAATDRLQGVYDQAVQKRKYDVYFVRK